MRDLPKNSRAFIIVLSELSRRDRDILIQRFIKKMSLKEVGRRWKVTDSLIKLREDDIIDKIEKTFDYYSNL